MISFQEFKANQNKDLRRALFKLIQEYPMPQTPATEILRDLATFHALKSLDELAYVSLGANIKKDKALTEAIERTVALMHACNLMVITAFLTGTCGEEATERRVDDYAKALQRCLQPEGTTLAGCEMIEKLLRKKA